MASKRRTNFSIDGYLSCDPDPYTDSKGKFRVELTIAFNSGAGFPAAFIEFIVYVQDVGEYIVDNFRKGDRIWVTNATPTGRKAVKKGQANFKFIIWDVALKSVVEKKGNVKLVSFKDGTDGNANS